MKKSICIISIIYNVILFVVSWFSILAQKHYIIQPINTVYCKVAIVLLILFHIYTLFYCKNKAIKVLTVCMQVPLMYFWLAVLNCFPVASIVDIVVCCILTVCYCLTYIFMKFDNKTHAKTYKITLGIIAGIQILFFIILLILVSYISGMLEPDYYSTQQLHAEVSPDNRYVVKIIKNYNGSHGHPDMLSAELYVNNSMNLGICQFESTPVYLYSEYDAENVEVKWLDNETIIINEACYSYVNGEFIRSKMD